MKARYDSLRLESDLNMDVYLSGCYKYFKWTIDVILSEGLMFFLEVLFLKSFRYSSLHKDNSQFKIQTIILQAFNIYFKLGSG